MFNQILGEEGAKRVSRWAVISLVLLSAFLLVKVIKDLKYLPSVGREVYPQSTIQVTGSGEVFAIPDVATFNFSVIEMGDTVQQAQEKADAKINAALTAVREAGIEDKDIMTSGYNVYPKYEWRQAAVTYPYSEGRQVLLGYEVNQTITVKVRDTEKAGDLVTQVGTVGVSNISGVQFTVDDRESFVAQAREQAIAEAKEKAKALADQLGVRLGKIMYYNENGAYPMYAEGLGGASDEVSVKQAAPMRAELPAGESKITSNVMITYEIK